MIKVCSLVGGLIWTVGIYSVKGTSKGCLRNLDGHDQGTFMPKHEPSD